LNLGLLSDQDSFERLFKLQLGIESAGIYRCSNQAVVFLASAVSSLVMLKTSYCPCCSCPCSICYHALVIVVAAIVIVVAATAPAAAATALLERLEAGATQVGYRSKNDPDHSLKYKLHLGNLY